MAQREKQKVKGCKKCGRTGRRQSRAGSPISLYVRGRISAKEYFSLTNQSYKD